MQRGYAFRVVRGLMRRGYAQGYAHNLRLHNLHNILIWADLQELASTWFRKTCTCAGSCALSLGDINRSAWSTHHRKHDPSIGAPILQLKR